MRIVSFEGIDRAYRKNQKVLDAVSFEVATGEVVGLLGANGAGKTTLLRIAMGMLEPQAGAVRVFGLDPRTEPLAVKRRVGYVSEDQILPEFLRVSEVLGLHRGLFPDWDDDLARRLGERFAIDASARIKTLSKGQARQVALLCAVAHRPPLLLLDEPAGGLDPAMRREFLETAIQLLGESGSTILFSSHHMTDVERLASRLVMLHEGQKWIDSALDDVREGYCLVLTPAGDGVDPAHLLGHPRCLSARQREGTVRAIFELRAESCERALARDLQLDDVRCHALPLEEMFIELVGGGRS